MNDPIDLGLSGWLADEPSGQSVQPSITFWSPGYPDAVAQLTFGSHAKVTAERGQLSVLEIKGRAVGSSIAAKGTLLIHFREGGLLTVEALPQAEAWELRLPGGRQFVCTPGGEVVEFRPTSGFTRFVDFVLRRLGR
jgi:hypothetical protein